MAYQGNLHSGQTVVIEHQGSQTVIRLSSGNQHQSSSFSTGPWSRAPTLWQTGDEAVLEIRSQNGPHYVRIGGGQVQTLSRAPSLKQAEALALQQVEDGTGQSEMKPLEPMKPMKPM